MIKKKTNLKKFLFGKLTRKGIFITLVATVFLLLFAYISLSGMNNIESIFLNIVGDSFTETTSISSLQYNLNGYNSEIMKYVITGRDIHLDNAKEFREIYFKKVNHLTQIVNHSSQWSFFESEAKEFNAEYFSVADKLIELKTDKSIDINNPQVLKYILKMENLLHPFENRLKSMQEYELNELQEKTGDLLASTNKTRREIIRSIIFFLLIGTMISGYVYNYISKPLKELSNAAEEVEKGNFEVRTDIKTGDEIEDLSKTFNKTITALGKVEAERKQIDKAKTEFLSITSHELRSPMTPMRAQLQMLMAGYFGKMNSKQKESISIVLNNTTRLDSIIMDLLEVSRIEAARLKFKFVRTNLATHIHTLVKEMRGFMPEKNIRIIEKIDTLPIIEVDPQRTMQVLRNLINNAIKFTPEKGEIEVRAKQSGEFIQISVKDNGVGISAEKQKRIFEPFYQAEQTIYRKHGGTGLGLTISRGIVESQKGNIWVNSELGHGTTFSFTVPLVPVKEISPIKLMFSEKVSIDKKLKDLFSDFLGPMGDKEFQDIQKDKGITDYIIYNYIDKLMQLGILDTERSIDFKRKATEIIGGKSLRIDIEDLFVQVLGPLGKNYVKKLGTNLNKRSIFGLVDMLEHKDILTKKELNVFKRSIVKILDGERTDKAVSSFFEGIKSTKEQDMDEFLSDGGGK